jgi:hypothetical protein
MRDISELKRMAEGRFSHSTDTAEFFGSFDPLILFWREVFEAPSLPLAMEVIAFPHRLDTFIEHSKQLEKNGIIPTGFHGQIGINSQREPNIGNDAKILLADSQIPSELDLFHRAKANFPNAYVLVHTPAMNGHVPDVAETDIHAEAVQDLLTLCRKHPNLIPAVDLFHIFLAHKAQDRKLHQLHDYIFNLNAWKLIIAELDRIYKEFGPCIIHIPVGTNMLDSLPADFMDAEMWKLLRPYILAGCHIVFEYQVPLHKRQFLFIPPPPPQLQRSLIQRTQKIMKPIAEAGLLDCLKK